MKPIISFLLTTLIAGTALAQTQVVAHRGYWDQPGSAQNSRRSLVKADSVGCWGSEFDVWMTRDGVVYLNHDETINGIEIQRAKSSEVAQQRLPNGELIPTLEQFLQVAQGVKLQLVCELKPHDDKQQEAQAVKKIVRLFKKYGLEDRVTYITFSYPGMRMLIKEAPKGTEVYYLNGELSPATLKHLGAAGLDYHYDIMHQHPEWFEQCRQLGLKTNVWTVNNAEEMKWQLDHGVDFITTNAPELLQSLIK